MGTKNKNFKTNKNDKRETKYMAYCPAHNWQGLYQETRQEAELDLEGHKGLFPDENHRGSSVVLV